MQSGMKECTFAPKVTLTGEQRNLSQFLQDQNKHLATKHQHIHKMAELAKEQQLSTYQGSPTINHTSRVLAESQVLKLPLSRQPVYDRLYSARTRLISKQEAAKRVQVSIT